MSDKPLMACGHTAQGYRKTKDDFIPCCVICGVTEQIKPNDKPDLTGRIATCCGKRSHKPSSFDLAFFEYRGPGSPTATQTCTCGYKKIAHDRAIPHVIKHCAEKNNGTSVFTARGPQEYDLYYCGCRGWD